MFLLQDKTTQVTENNTIRKTRNSVGKTNKSGDALDLEEESKSRKDNIVKFSPKKLRSRIKKPENEKINDEKEPRKTKTKQTEKKTGTNSSCDADDKIEISNKVTIAEQTQSPIENSPSTERVEQVTVSNDLKDIEKVDQVTVSNDRKDNGNKLQDFKAEDLTSSIQPKKQIPAETPKKTGTPCNAHAAGDIRDLLLKFESQNEQKEEKGNSAKVDMEEMEHSGESEESDWEDVAGKYTYIKVLLLAKSK